MSIELATRALELDNQVMTPLIMGKASDQYVIPRLGISWKGIALTQTQHRQFWDYFSLEIIKIIEETFKDLPTSMSTEDVSTSFEKFMWRIEKRMIEVETRLGYRDIANLSKARFPFLKRCNDLIEQRIEEFRAKKTVRAYVKNEVKTNPIRTMASFLMGGLAIVGALRAFGVI